MRDTSTILVAEKGRLVIPAAIRSRLGWTVGTELVPVETEHGVTLVARDAALALVRRQLSGSSLAQEIIAERHAEAAAEGSST